MKSLNQDRVYFLPKDPHWTFVGWHITSDTMDKMAAQMGGDITQARLTLRVHDVTDILFDGTNSHHSFDVDVKGNTDHWYLEIWASNRNYCVEVGFRTTEGTFYPAVRSNTLCLPRDRPSDSSEARWSLPDGRQIEEKGYLLLVLHTHLPFVRDPEIEYPLEENWLFEGLTESYIPLVQALHRLVQHGADLRITFSFTPTLVSMLTDELLQSRYVRYLEERKQLAEHEIARLQSQPRFAGLARGYRDKIVEYRQTFQDWDHNLISAFKALSDSGHLDILASGATHAYFPLWELYPRAVDLQIQIGIQHYQKTFGKRPLGFWLPECGFPPGGGLTPSVDQLLHKAGIQYFFLDECGVLNGHPRPKYGVHAPIHCPTGVAAFGRDLESHDQVWLKHRGYWGAPCYLNTRRDLGFDGNVGQKYLFPFTHHDTPVNTGIKYYRNAPIEGSDVYDAEIAITQCCEHASRFVQQCQERVEYLYAQSGKRPVLVALFDTDLFGHWWNEGPIWLEQVIRKLNKQTTIKMIAASDYLRMYPVNQVVTPSLSSWGYQRYSETWLMGRNHWMYPELYEAIDLGEKLVEMGFSSQPEVRAACNQYLRELLLAQGSDWAYWMHREVAQQYAEQRVKGHLENMRAIYHQVSQNRIDMEWLDALQDKNNIFADMDLLTIYRECRGV